MILRFAFLMSYVLCLMSKKKQSQSIDFKITSTIIVIAVIRLLKTQPAHPEVIFGETPTTAKKKAIGLCRNI